MSEKEKVVYTVKEVGVLLGLSRTSAYRYIKDSTIPAIKIGRKILISKKAFHKWLDGDYETKNRNIR